MSFDIKSPPVHQKKISYRCTILSERGRPGQGVGRPQDSPRPSIFQKVSIFIKYSVMWEIFGYPAPHPPFQTCSLLSPASWSVLSLVKIRLLTPIPNLACSLHIWPTSVGGLEEVFQDTTPRLPSVSWGYHISSTCVMSHPHFHLKVKGHTGKNIFIHAQRLPLELVFLMKFVPSQNPITQPV